MNISISACKTENIICVNAEPVNIFSNLSNIVFIPYVKTNDERYNQEIEYKMRQEFNEYVYENYTKRGCKLDNYTKNKIWNTFKYQKYMEEKSISAYLHKLWEEFEDKYLL